MPFSRYSRCPTTASPSARCWFARSDWVSLPGPRSAPRARATSDGASPPKRRACPTELCVYDALCGRDVRRLVVHLDRAGELGAFLDLDLGVADLARY